MIIEARKQDAFDAVDNQATKSLESLSQKKDDVEKPKLCWNEVSYWNPGIQWNIRFNPAGTAPKKTLTLNVFFGLVSLKVENWLTFWEFVFSETKEQQSASELPVVVIFYRHRGEVLSF